MPKIAILKLENFDDYAECYNCYTQIQNNSTFLKSIGKWTEVSQDDLDTLNRVYRNGFGINNTKMIILREASKKEIEETVESFLKQARELDRKAEAKRMKNEIKEQKRQATLAKKKKQKEKAELERARDLLKKAGEL